MLAAASHLMPTAPFASGIGQGVHYEKMNFPAHKEKAPEYGAFSVRTCWRKPFNFGGKGRIRTDGTPKRTLDFESSAFDHSATFPFRSLCGAKRRKAQQYSRVSGLTE
jgi:hypothetical protein